MSIQKTQDILSPDVLKREILVSPDILWNIHVWRDTIRDMIHGKDNRLLVIVGPCSIHDPKAAIEYAGYVQKWREEFKDTLEIVMRTYWEKPRTIVWWKWLINDPHLDGSFDIVFWLRTARQLLLDIAHMWVPTATEFLDPLSVGYIADLISWGAIGARTTESQTHRELASGLPCPIGFKNGTDGSIKIAIDAMQSAKHEHMTLSAWENGKIGILKTKWNPDTHIILRWSNQWINFDSDNVDSAASLTRNVGCPSRIMIDVSHQNSQKKHNKQMQWIDAVVDQVMGGSNNILGVMIESNLVEWNHSYIPWKDNKNGIPYGKSITDACVDLHTTYDMFKKLAYARR